jgi:hypothetical protein
MVGPCGLEPQTSSVSTYDDYEMQRLTANGRQSCSLFYP